MRHYETDDRINTLNLNSSSIGDEGAKVGRCKLDPSLKANPVFKI